MQSVKKRKKRVLLIGDPRSIYIEQYIENVLEPMGFEIFIPYNKKQRSGITSNFYKFHNIFFIKMLDKNDNLLFKIPIIGNKFCAFVNLLRLFSKKAFDYVHVQYVTKYDLMKALAASNKNTRRFASFWGSDLLRQTDKKLNQELKYLNKFDFVSADSYVLKKKYDEIFPNAKNYMEIIYFGVTLFDYIDKYSLDVNNCKLYFGLPITKKIVSIGYNSTVQQQHELVLKSLKNIINKEDYFLVFQMTYGTNTDKEYIIRLKEQLQKSGFDSIVIEKFLSMDELAKLRLATDVFINAQTTDAFCNSIKEYFYAKTQIISANWLHYPEIDKFPLFINEFSEFSEIPELLNNSLSEEKIEWNKSMIKKESTWKSCLEKWQFKYN